MGLFDGLFGGGFSGDDEFGFGLGQSGPRGAVNRQAAGQVSPTTFPGGFGGTDIFGEFGPASIALGGLKTLGSIWNSFQQNKLAKKSLKFQKKAFQTNLANSTKVYNTALEDRIRARFATEGRSGEADAKIAANRL